jgi:hypothetical protein
VNIYRLTREDAEEGLDELYEMVVIAADEDGAYLLAAKEAAREGPDAWAGSAILHVGTANNGFTQGVICRDSWRW